MAQTLLLYDLKDKDLARDFKDLLEALDVKPIVMVAPSADGGRPLEEKERKCFDEATGAIFVITPGAERLGKLYPSPSVSHEMGQAKQKFGSKPDSVIYLVDERCDLPAIDQLARIPFNQTDARSILGAVTQLIRDMKAASLLRTAPISQKITATPAITVEQFCSRLSDEIKKVLLEVSNLQNGYIDDAAFNKMLTQTHRLTMQATNLLKRDLQAHNVMTQSVTTQPYYFNGWFISPLGWDVVRLEIERRQEIDQRATSAILRLLKGSPTTPAGGLLASQLAGPVARLLPEK